MTPQEADAVLEKAGVPTTPIPRAIPRGSKSSLDNTKRNATKHTDWRDSVREGLGKVLLAPRVEDINWSEREVDKGTGLVKVTGSDAFYGVSQPELQAEYETWRRGQLDASDAGRAYETEFGVMPSSTIGEKDSSRLDEGDLTRATTNEANRKTNVKEAFKTLNALEVTAEGQVSKNEALAGLRAKPNVTADDINEAYSNLIKYNPETISTRGQAAANLSYKEAQTADIPLARQNEKDFNDAQIAVSKGRLNLDARSAYNDNIIATRNAAVQELNARNNRIQLENADRSSQLDRELRRDMAIMTRDDNREDRRYNREADARKDRQMMILQLMKGLSAAGQNLAI